MQSSIKKRLLSASLSFAIAFSCVEALSTETCADKSTTVSQTAERNKSLPNESVTVNSRYDHMFVRFVDSEDNVYCYAYNAPSNLTAKTQEHIVKINSEGKIIKTVKGSGDVFKQFGDKIYVLQTKHDDDNKSIKGMICKVYNMDLELEKTYKLTYAKSTQYADVNAKQVCYLSGSKIYIRDLNGKNQKLLYDLSAAKGELEGTFCQGVALTEDYAGFIAEKYEDNGTVRKTWAVVVNLKTGETQIEEQPALWTPQAYDKKIIWNSNPVNSSNIFSSSKQLVVFENGSFDVVKTSTEKEALQSGVVDSSGRIITSGYTNSDGIWLKVYENGKAKKKIIIGGTSLVSYNVNENVFAYSYEEKVNGKYYVKTVLMPY